MDAGFGTEFTVGLEEELLLIDPATREFAPVATEVLGRLDTDRAIASHEAFAAQIELRSPPCRTAVEAGAALKRARAAAQDAGATLLGVGVHPTAPAGEFEIVDQERYRRVAQSMRGLFGRTPESALHVHVGMPDPETAIRCFNAVREHLRCSRA